MSDTPASPQGEGSPRFGRYRILGTLGQGGMGSVFLAEDESLGRKVALKKPRLDAPLTPQARARFEREARAAAALSHPSLCPVFDFGVIDGVPYFTMPYLAGPPLRQVMLRRGPLEPHKALALASRLAKALAVAHASGVVHRDLKPSNILLQNIDGQTVPVVVDFGLARVDDDSAVPITRAGDFLGTPAYMAPEQLRADTDRVGPATDVYALASILYELLTGCRPFEGESWMKRALNEPPDAPSRRAPKVGPEIDALILRAMAKEPEDRYPTMSALAAAIDEARGNRKNARGVSNEFSSLIEKAPSVPLPETVRDPSATTPSSPQATALASAGPASRSTPWTRRSVLALGTMLTAGTVWYFASRKDPIPPPPKPDPGETAKRDEPRKDDPTPPPTPGPEPKPAPLASRTPSDIQARQANWVEGSRWSVSSDDTLVKLEPERCAVGFGSNDWTDYTLSFDVRRIAGEGPVRVLVRAQGDAYEFLLGAEAEQHFMNTLQGGQPTITRVARGTLTQGTWYHVKIRVDGATIECRLDDRRIFYFLSRIGRQGPVALGFNDAAGWFRGIKVEAIDGTLLWEGPPIVK